MPAPNIATRTIARGGNLIEASKSLRHRKADKVPKVDGMSRAEGKGQRAEVGQRSQVRSLCARARGPHFDAIRGAWRRLEELQARRGSGLSFWQVLRTLMSRGSSCDR